MPVRHMLTKKKLKKKKLRIISRRPFFTSPVPTHINKSDRSGYSKSYSQQWVDNVSKNQEDNPTLCPLCFFTHFPLLITSPNPNHKTLLFRFTLHIHHQQTHQSLFYVSTATVTPNKSKPRSAGMVWTWTSFVPTSSWRILALGGLVDLAIILSKFTIKPSLSLLSGSLFLLFQTPKKGKKNEIVSNTLLLFLVWLIVDLNYFIWS